MNENRNSDKKALSCLILPVHAWDAVDLFYPRAHTEGYTHRLFFSSLSSYGTDGAEEKALVRPVIVRIQVH